MAKHRAGPIGRPKTDPGDPQLPVNPQRVRAALLFSGLSQREAIAEARRRKLAPLTLKGLHGLSTGRQHTSRRSRLESLAAVTNVGVPYLTEQADEDLVDALAQAFAISDWDTYAKQTKVHAIFGEIEAVAADARVVLDLKAGRRRCSYDAGPISQEERDVAAIETLGVLRMLFGRRRRREALSSLRAWLQEAPE